MRTQKLAMGCPVCGANDVYYTCTPNCCFNHVCGTCGATFEPVTVTTGRTVFGVSAPDPLPEASDPTVGCAKCDATTVYLLSDGGLVCTACGSVLTLEFTEIAPS